MSFDEIKKLDPKERIILMNDIWESFELEGIVIDSPRWHDEVLKTRVDKIKRNEAKYISIEELKVQ